MERLNRHQVRYQVEPPTRWNLLPGQTSKGQSLLEAIVALAVAMLVILALVWVTTVSIRNADFAKKQAQASKYGQEGMEKVRAFRDQNTWEAFKSGCSTYDLGLVPSPFTRPKPNCQEIATDKIKVTITVSWTDSAGTHKSELISYFSKWK